MKNLLKKLCIATSVLGVAAIMGGCSSTPESANERNIEYVQTHQKDDVTSVHARMRQKSGERSRMGSVRFTETQSGMKMVVDLRDLRPSTEYSFVVYEITGCEVQKDRTNRTAKKIGECEKVKQNIQLPAFRSGQSGNALDTYMITGLTAAELNNKRLGLTRENDKGETVTVGWGALKEGGLF